MAAVVPGSRCPTVAPTTVAPTDVVDTVAYWDAMVAVACASVEEGVARRAVVPDVALLVSPSTSHTLTMRFVHYGLTNDYRRLCD